MTEAIEKMKETVKESVQPIKASVDYLESRLKAIEDLPIVKAPSIITTPSAYEGRKLAKQGVWFRNQIKDEKIADGMAKMLIDIALRKTTMQEGTPAYGGYLVPEEYQPELVQLARNTSFALQVARVINMGRDVMLIPNELSLGASTWIDEGSEKTASEPTVAQIKLTAKKLMNLAVASDELIADSEFDIASLLAEQFAYTMGMELDNQMFNGTGNPVSGVLTAKAGYSAVLGGNAFSAITAVDLSKAIAEIEEGRLAGSRFLLGRKASHFVRTLKDKNDRPIYAEVGGATPRTIYEFSVNVSESIPNIDGTDKPLGVFGNFNYFFLGRRAGGMVIESDPYTRFAFTEVRFRMVTRWAMAVADPKAFCRIITG